MKQITIKSNRKFMFVCKEDAENTLRYAKEIACVYGYVTVADILDLIDATPTYVENRYGWTPDAIERAEIRENHYTDYLGDINHAYILCLPHCDWENNVYAKETKDVKTPSTGEPINITISSSEWNTRRNDIEQVFNEFFRHSDKIKDRPVFITIM